MNRLLYWKHWQLFILALGLPLLANMLPSFILRVNGTFSSTAFALIMGATFAGTWLCLCVLIGWFYAIGKGLQPYLPEAAKGNTGRLKLLVVPVVFVGIIAVYSIAGVLGTGPELHKGWRLNTVLMLLALGLMHLLSLFCILYGLYFAAKTLKAAELKRKVTFSDFAVEFFLMWIFPVGVWIIQPRLNKIVSREPEHQMDIFRQICLRGNGFPPGSFTLPGNPAPYHWAG